MNATSPRLFYTPFQVASASWAVDYSGAAPVWHLVNPNTSKLEENQPEPRFVTHAVPRPAFNAFIKAP